MNAKNLNKIKNKPSLLRGLSAGLIYILFVSESLQFLFAELFNASDTSLNFNYIFFTAEFSLNGMLSSFKAVVVSLAPLISVVLFSEISSFLIRKVVLGYYRFSLIVFQLFLIGYSLLYLLYQTIMVVTGLNVDSDFNKMLTFLGVIQPYNLLLVLLIIFIFGAYINLSAKIINGYIAKKSTENN